MQKEFNSTNPCTNDAAVFRPLSEPPENVVCVVQVFASCITRSGSGGNHWHETFQMDYSVIPEALGVLEDFREKAAKYIKPDPVLGDVRDSKIEAEFWLGRPGQFEPRPSDPNKLWPLRDSRQPLCMRDGDISTENISAALQSFYTPEAHALNARLFEQVVALPEKISVNRPLRLKR